MSVASIRTMDWATVDQVNGALKVITVQKEKSFYRVVWGFVLGFIFLAAFLMAAMLRAEDRRHAELISQATHTVTQVADTTPAQIPVSPPRTEAIPKMVNPVAGLDSAVMAYTVKAGDTLWGLAGKHWSAVCQDNRLRDCDLILTGQVLQLPQSFLREKEKRNE